jgi:dihydrofolate synthase/folylpolyglutamate synthase
MNPHAFLEALTPSTMKFGLERMRAVDAALGHPWRAYRTLHVAGTNGKGSTCAFAESILRVHGLKVGLYSSPHLEKVNERIRVHGAQITDAQLERGIAAINGAYQGDALTYFEFLTALALWHFRQEQVDVGIIEVGLGGKLDGTNIITADVAAIATIAFDHREFLGNTRGAIASEKAGILKAGKPAAVLTRQPEALKAIDAIAAQVGAPLKHAGVDFGIEEGVLRVGAVQLGTVQLALAGAHQLGNASLAAQATLLLYPQLTASTIRDGLARAQWPGRLETVGGVLLDGAHNLEGAQALAAHLRTLRRPVHLIFGARADKDVAEMVEALGPAATALYLVAPASPRALQPASYLERARSYARTVALASLGEALDAARTASALDGGQVVVAGSLYLVGPARTLLSTLGAARRDP